MQPWHLAIIVLVFLLLFGAKRLPDAARGLGRSLRILKSEVGAMSEDKKAETPTPAPTDARQILTPSPVQTSGPVVEVASPQPAPVAPAGATKITLNGRPLDEVR